MNLNRENIKCVSQQNGKMKVMGVVIIGDDQFPWEVEINPRAMDVDGKEYLLDDVETKLLTEIRNLYHSTIK